MIERLAEAEPDTGDLTVWLRRTYQSRRTRNGRKAPRSFDSI
jgi:hypothetical protein